MYERNGKINVIFDGSVLTNGLHCDSGKSGIFFVASKIFECFLQNENINLSLFLPNGSTYEVDKLKDFGIIPNDFNNIITTTNIPNWCYNLLDYSYDNKTKPFSSIIRSIYNRFKRLGNIICNKKLKKYCNFQKYDIYFSPLNNIPNFISKNKSILSYMLVHDLIPILCKDFYKKHYIFRMNEMEKILKSLNHNVKYFTVSNSTKNDLLKINSDIKSETVTTTYPFISHFNSSGRGITANELRIKYKILNDKKYILSLCSVEPRKNIIFSIKNYLNFIKMHEIDDLVFVVGGGIWKEYKTIYENFIATIPKDKVINIGYVDETDIFTLYSDAYIFVYPSLYEGFGLPVLEAMHAGCPVITSNFSSLPEVIGDAGIQIDPTSDDDMLKAYNRMYFDSNFREECIRRGFDRAKQFSWEKCTTIMYDQFCKDLKNENSI